jgi:voltage-gated potassium channel
MEKGGETVLFLANLILRLIRMNNGLTYGLVVLFIVCASGAAYLLEPDTFGTPFNGFWWVMTTVTTVGYGDFYPKTIAGKWLGIFLYIFGIGLISITISKVVDALMLYQRRKEEGKLRFTGENHFVIVDWSIHADLAIKEILETDASAQIVLIDTMEKSPIQHHRVHYIRGNPVRKETLEMAGLSRARAVFIFAKETTQQSGVIQDTSFIDGKSLLVATAIERNFDHVHTVVEIKDELNLPNFQHVKVDEFILGTETVSRLAVRSAFSPGTSQILSQLLARGNGDDLFELRKKPHWHTYRDAFEELLQQGATLISDGSRLDINKRLGERIPDDARLFVICTKETYQMLQS